VKKNQEISKIISCDNPDRGRRSKLWGALAPKTTSANAASASLRLFSFGGYGLALAALALVVSGAYDSYPQPL